MPGTWMQQARRRQLRDAREPHVTRPELKDAWGEWLGRREWDWFVTLTFAAAIQPWLAARVYDAWARSLQAEVGRPMVHARALEWQKRGVLHFHALVWNVARRTRRDAWAARWQSISGGFARIEEYERQEPGRFYLGKYVSKGGGLDLLRYGDEPAHPDDVRLIPQTGRPRG